MVGELHTYPEEMHPKITDSSTELSASFTLNLVPQTISCHPNGCISITLASISPINALNLNFTTSKVLDTSNLLHSQRLSQLRLLNTHLGDRLDRLQVTFNKEVDIAIAKTVVGICIGIHH